MNTEEIIIYRSFTETIHIDVIINQESGIIILAILTNIISRWL